MRLRTAPRPLARSRRAALISSRSRAEVAIVEDARGSDREGLVESIHRRRDEVEARLVLDDGAPAIAVLAPDDADWLEIEQGDIVFVAVA
jgi:hypothetical protein